MENFEQSMSQPRFKYLFCLSVTLNNLGLYGHRECRSGIKIDEKKETRPEEREEHKTAQERDIKQAISGYNLDAIP